MSALKVNTIGAGLLIASFTCSVALGNSALSSNYSGLIDLTGTANGVVIDFHNDDAHSGGLPGSSLNDDQNVDSINGVFAPNYDGYGTIWMHFAQLTLTQTISNPQILTGSTSVDVHDGNDTTTLLIMSVTAQHEIMAPLDMLVMVGTVTVGSETNPGSGTYNWTKIDTFSYIAQTFITPGFSSIKDVIGNTDPDTNYILSAGGSGQLYYSASVTVPEPSSFAILGLGFGAFAVGGARRRLFA